jgi:hypothetical protein
MRLLAMSLITKIIVCQSNVANKDHSLKYKANDVADKVNMRYNY